MNIIKNAFVVIVACTAFAASNVYSAAPMQIFVTTQTGKKIAINVNPATDTVGDLKRKIQNQEGPPADTQRIILGGRQLDNDQILGNIRPKLQELEVIHLVIREPQAVAQRPQPQPMFAEEAVEQRYRNGATVIVSVKGNRTIGVIKSFDPDGVYLIDIGDKERSFFEGEITPYR